MKPEAKFCPYCGAEVRKAPVEEPAPAPARSEVQPPVAPAPKVEKTQKEKKPPKVEKAPKVKPEPQSAPAKKKFPLIPLICGILAAAVLAGGIVFLLRSDAWKSLSGVLADRDIGVEDSREDRDDWDEDRDNDADNREAEGDDIDQDQNSALADSDTDANTEPTPEPTVEPTPVPAPDCQQEILVESNGSTATLTLLEWENGEWVQRMSGDAWIGSNGVSYDKREGDHCTPAGTFNVLFYISDQSYDTALDGIMVYSGDVWITDYNSQYYNTLQNASYYAKDWKTAENLYEKFTKNRSEACIYFDYNGDGLTAGSATYPGGSDIFIDAVGSNGKLTSGYGDIKIQNDTMVELLGYLDSSKNPIITIY